MTGPPAKTPIALGVTFPLLATIAVGARFWARKKKGMARRIDDWMLIPSLILSIGNAISMILAAVLGDMGKLKPLDENGFPPLDESFETFYKCIFANNLLTTAAMAVTRHTILLFYGRIFRGRAFAISKWTLYILNGIWGIAYFFVFVFTCDPISDKWELPNGSKERDCLPVSTAQSHAVSSVLLDMAVLLVPWPPIMRLSMSKREKAAVLGIFGLGFVVVVVAIGKAVEFYVVVGELARSHQIQYILAPTMYWTIPETCIAVVGACLPTLRPIFHGWSPESVIGSVRSALSLGSLSSNHRKDGSPTKTSSQPTSHAGTDSVRGLRDSQEYDIPPLPPFASKSSHKEPNEIHVESQVIVSSDPRDPDHGLREEP
ncbi:hypothetical protein BS50DRAFT_671333 [Corynespora cassiicola Philippines]|uniref:Rhodopsin domain-containing protein n=1 Tax=Corynespora cassiicola Philippines TaxID=1448308 RepID=A0A2T2PBR1_CORCC|nr:hypothetical protein BS50DRAFT_671333 [Corynespora cassiicola Philippines]